MAWLAATAAYEGYELGALMMDLISEPMEGGQDDPLLIELY